MQVILSQDLGAKPYNKPKCLGLTENGKEKRLDLLEPHLDFENSVFCAEETSAYIPYRVEDIPEDMRSVCHFQNESKVMVWAAVSEKGEFSPRFCGEKASRSTPITINPIFSRRCLNHTEI